MMNRKSSLALMLWAALQDITALRRVVFVMKGGRVYKNGRNW